MSEQTDNNEKILQLVSFKIEKEEFGVNILMVQEIIRMMKVTSVPNSPDYVDGVVNLRGKVIPVLDLRKRLGLAPKERDKDTRIVVVEISSKTIGFIVDEVNEVLRIPESITEPPPKMIGGVESQFITAVGKLEDRLLILLDLERIFSDEMKEELSLT